MSNVPEKVDRAWVGSYLSGLDMYQEWQFLAGLPSLLADKSYWHCHRRPLLFYVHMFWESAALWQLQTFCKCLQDISLIDHSLLKSYFYVPANTADQRQLSCYISKICLWMPQCKSAYTKKCPVVEESGIPGRVLEIFALQIGHLGFWLC